MKTCSRCGKLKPTKEYAPDKSYKDGLSIWCKLCLNFYNTFKPKRKQ